MGRMDIGKCAAENQGCKGIQEVAAGIAKDGIQVEEMDPTSKTNTSVHLPTYQKSFFAITISTKCFDEINHGSSAREEAFTVLNVQLPGLKGLRLKIVTGASH